jgi:replicative DNA helicase
VIDTLPTLKSMPHSEESERAVLGALLLEPSRIKEIALRPEEFFLERHQAIYRGMVAIDARGGVVDLRTLQAELEDRGAFERAGGISYLATLDLDLPDIGRIESYAKIVRERAQRRRLIECAGEVIRGALDGGADAGQVAAQAQATMISVIEQAAPQGYRSLAELAEITLENLERRAEHGTAGTVVTPWAGLNAILEHLETGSVYVVCGPPGAGKTSFLVQMMASMAFDQRKSVGVVSLEMKSEELTERLVALRTGVAFSALRSYSSRMSQGQRNQATKALVEWRGADVSIEIDDSPFQTAADIVSRLRRLHRCRRGIDAFMIDYAGLMRMENPRNRDLELMASVNMIKDVAKELGVPCVLFAQVNHEAVHDAVRGKTPRALSQTAGGTALPQVAYAQIYLDRDVDDAGEFQGRGRFVVPKHRGGPTGRVPVFFNGPTMTWEEREADAQD